MALLPSSIERMLAEVEIEVNQIDRFVGDVLPEDIEIVPIEQRVPGDG